MFITFEGIDGSGKTTQVDKFCEYLRTIGKSVLQTKEPGGGGEFSLSIRQILRSSDTILKSELLAIYAARNEHIQKQIIPALQSGITVVCDRFIDSSIAYYCEGLKDQDLLDAENDVWILQKMVGNIMPDLTFFMNINIDESYKRSSQRDIQDKYDNFNLRKKANINKIYLNLCHRYPERIKKIDANQNIEKIFQNIINIFQNF